MRSIIEKNRILWTGDRLYAVPFRLYDDAAPFQITYTDNANLYICIGYGEQETGGYSIAVNELYLTDANIVIDTSLLGPEPSEKENPQPSCPYIVVKTEYLEQTVTFE